MANTNKFNNRVRIVTRNNSTFEGVLHYADESTGKLILKNVVTDGVKLFGPQRFYSADLIDLQYLNDVPDDGMTCLTSLPKQDQQHSNNVADDRTTGLALSPRKKKNLYKKCSRPHLSKLQVLDSDVLTLASVYKDENPLTLTGQDDDRHGDFEDFNETEQYLLINRICEKFYEAIINILGQSVVAVQLDGVSIGRNGTLSVVEIATEDTIFIFDILRMGDDVFDEGLRKIFEDKNVMKVTHDCRFLSDMIHHKYDIAFNNVFDTQVASAFVFKINNNGDWPRYVENLPVCLMNHLYLSYDQVHFTRTRETGREKDEAVWLERPLPHKLLVAVSKNIGYLIKLHAVLLSRMLVEFTAGVKIFLNHIDSLGGEVEKCRQEKHLLPVAFTDLQHYVKLYNLKSKKQNKSTALDNNGFRVNQSRLNDKEILFSHDSVWHVSRSSHAKSHCHTEKYVSNDTSDKSNLAKKAERKPKKSFSNEPNHNKANFTTNLEHGSISRSPHQQAVTPCKNVSDTEPSNDNHVSEPSSRCNDCQSFTSETDSKSHKKFSPGRMQQFCQYLQTISIECDGSETEMGTEQQQPAVNHCSANNLMPTLIHSSKDQCYSESSDSSSQEQNAILSDDEGPSLPVKTHDPFLNFLPAGLRNFNVNHKNKDFLSNKGKGMKTVETRQNTDCDSVDEEDYGCIPMQHSLERFKIAHLNSGDTVSDYDNYEDDETNKEANEDDSSENLSQDSEKFQKILKCAFLNSNSDIKRKLLPSKLKL
ncbi:piRNA biogenesis protein exd1 [Bulinus truncatus]|nr:piRNA biogenesis protein exd1 [Bulinus truncatus]